MCLCACVSVWPNPLSTRTKAHALSPPQHHPPAALYGLFYNSRETLPSPWFYFITDGCQFAAAVYGGRLDGPASGVLTPPATRLDFTSRESNECCSTCRVRRGLVVSLVGGFGFGARLSGGLQATPHLGNQAGEIAAVLLPCMEHKQHVWLKKKKTTHKSHECLSETHLDSCNIAYELTNTCTCNAGSYRGGSKTALELQGLGSLHKPIDKVAKYVQNVTLFAIQ